VLGVGEIMNVVIKNKNYAYTAGKSERWKKNEKLRKHVEIISIKM
jgi:hypothetical protein